MNTLATYTRLFAVGRAAGRGSAGRGLRFTSLLCATFALALTGAVLIAGFAVYDGRELRGSARAPQYIGVEEPDQAPLLVQVAYDDVGGVQRSVVFLDPRGDAVAPPPGVERWPAPGEVVLSEALRADLLREGSPDRYGKPAGSISESGLEVPGERLAYVRPVPGLIDPGNMTTAAGFGSDERSVYGDRATVPPLSAFISLVVGMLLFPAVVLVVVAARSGAAGRDRRVALLRALGAGARARAVVNAGEAALPVALGAVAAAAVVGLALPSNLTVPVVDFVLPAADLRRWAPLLFSAVLAAALAVLAAVTLLHRTGRAGQGTRPRARGRFTSRRLAWLCPVFLLVATRGPDLLAGGGSLWFLVYAAGVVGTLATLPALVAAAVSALGRLLVRTGNRYGRPGALIAGRRAVAQPGVTARLVASVVVAIGLVTQIQLNTSLLDDAMIAAKATHERIGDSMLTVSSAADREQNGAFLRALPEGAHGLAMEVAHSDGRSLGLYGDCAALRALDAPCGTSTADPADPRVRELAAWFGGDAADVVLHRADPTERLTRDAERLLVISGSGDLAVGEVKEAAFRELPAPQVMVVAGEWLFGAAELQKPAAWTLFLGIVGVGLLAFAAAANNLGDFLRFGHTLAPLSVLVSHRGVFYSAAVWAILVPLAAAGALGVLVSLWLAAPMTAKGAVLTWAFLASLLVLAQALAVLFWFWGSRSAAVQAVRWRPTAD
ncbi:hypothetical protein GCM10023079_17670 [Streptomyces chitinivorans]|uniref:FtsX-like permease family protein n=1 Tax=Streptomyces chitinivorans TaxID=1257027 RepID=UPI00244B7C3B|nr:FtsX-like permease family protein [Streptomyces chitinivorans]MDH2410684.1 ABC transporter permease [Streptomyces chitinivorans]